MRARTAKVAVHLPGVVKVGLVMIGERGSSAEKVGKRVSPAEHLAENFERVMVKSPCTAEASTAAAAVASESPAAVHAFGSVSIVRRSLFVIGECFVGHGHLFEHLLRQLLFVRVLVLRASRVDREAAARGGNAQHRIVCETRCDSRSGAAVWDSDELGDKNVTSHPHSSTLGANSKLARLGENEREDATRRKGSRS